MPGQWLENELWPTLSHGEIFYQAVQDLSRTERVFYAMKALMSIKKKKAKCADFKWVYWQNI